MPILPGRRRFLRNRNGAVNRAASGVQTRLIAAAGIGMLVSRTILYIGG